jgi:hypothetical protein
MSGLSWFGLGVVVGVLYMAVIAAWIEERRRGR